MAVPSTPLFGNPKRISTSAAAKASAGKLWGVLLEGGSTASSIDFFDHATSESGLTAIFAVTAPCTTDTTSGQDTAFIDLTPFGGIDFALGIWCVIAGTGAIAYVWFS